MLWQSFKFLISQDIVDILVGWHVDIGQSPSLKMHISSVLLSWHSFWIIDLEFSAGLLRQFIEDVESFTEDVEEYRHDFLRNHQNLENLSYLENNALLTFSSHSGNLVFGCFWQLPKYYIIVWLLFLLSKPRQAKRKLRVKNITQPK